jgi:hypothetical protein
LSNEKSLIENPDTLIQKIPIEAAFVLLQALPIRPSTKTKDTAAIRPPALKVAAPSAEQRRAFDLSHSIRSIQFALRDRHGSALTRF